MPSTSTSPMSTCSYSSVSVLDQPGLEPGSDLHDQPFVTVKAKKRRHKPSTRPQPLSQPTADTHTLLFRPKGNASLQSADFPVLLQLLQTLGALLPARWIRGGGLAVDFATEERMDSSSSVTALAGIKVKATKPVQFACRSGVVGGVPPELSPSAFLAEVAAGNPNLRIHRVQRLGNSWAMKVVFVGSCLPTNLQFRFRSHPVRAFAKKVLPAKPNEAKCTEKGLAFSAAPVSPAVKTTQAKPDKKKPSSSSAALVPATKPSRQEPAKRKLSFSAALASSPSKRPVSSKPRKQPPIAKPAGPAPVLVETAIQTDEIDPPAPIRQVFRPKGLRASTIMVAESCTQIRPVFFQRTRSTMTDKQALPAAISIEHLVGAAYCLGCSSLRSTWQADFVELQNLVLQFASQPPDLQILSTTAQSTVQDGEPTKMSH